MRGIKKLTMFTRKVIFMKGSQLDLSAPSLSQKFNKLQPGADGGNGRHGADGPIVEVYAKVLTGYVKIDTSGGDGNRGQNGADGSKGADVIYSKDDKTDSDCKNGKTTNGCTKEISGTPGDKGGDGGDAGDAGRSGNGGNAGRQTFYAANFVGHIVLKTCRGNGGQAAENGAGGPGGRGGRGGHGVRCKKKIRSMWGRSWGLSAVKYPHYCTANGKTDEAKRGKDGAKGDDGDAKTSAGNNGQVERSYIQFFLTLRRKDIRKYPLSLLKLMARYAEDLIWANRISNGKAVFRFLLRLTQRRSDSSELRKVAKRRLAFLNKEGYDRFGKNKLFAPLMKYEAFKEEVETMRDDARDFENDYNGIKKSIENEEGIKKVLEAFPKTARKQVDKERTRLKRTKGKALDRKRTYVLAITQLEASMNNYLAETMKRLPDVYEKAQFKKGDLFVILQGITSFTGGVMGGSLSATPINSALDIIKHFSLKCALDALKGHLDNIERRLNFGKAYAALNDSNKLDFGKMDLNAVPEVMKANLVMNKKRLTADLICLLDLRSSVITKAKIQQQIEQFFIAGAARIDLIAKVIDLDNEIGGYNFHINNLKETSNEIKSLGKSDSSHIADTTRQMFLDDLLTSYQEIETRFARSLYQLYKSFEFRTLWDVGKRLSKFQRRAVSAAKGTGRLHGVLELTNALNQITNLENKLRRCNTKFPHDVSTETWSFDNVNNKVMFDELKKGTTRFSLDISDSCDDCYNVRLLKIFVELYGDKSQRKGKYPADVFLELRHLGDSSFRDGNDKVKQYRQPVTWRKLKFNRFSITNQDKCDRLRTKGKKNTLFCIEKDDSRFKPMCCHYLSDSPCKDKQLGAEECRSPFGTYEISIPIDKKARCRAKGSKVTHKNCKNFDISMFTNMNVHIQYLYWPKKYSTGPNDRRCSGFKDLSINGHLPAATHPNITLDYEL
ncbi:uncharacterized protein LOC144642898 isoform X2 [Oculina patagonica]